MRKHYRSFWTPIIHIVVAKCLNERSIGILYNSLNKLRGEKFAWVITKVGSQRIPRANGLGYLFGIARSKHLCQRHVDTVDLIKGEQHPGRSEEHTSELQSR